MVDWDYLYDLDKTDKRIALEKRLESYKHISIKVFLKHLKGGKR